LREELKKGIRSALLPYDDMREKTVLGTSQDERVIPLVHIRRNEGRGFRVSPSNDEVRDAHDVVLESNSNESIDVLGDGDENLKGDEGLKSAPKSFEGRLKNDSCPPFQPYARISSYREPDLRCEYLSIGESENSATESMSDVEGQGNELTSRASLDEKLGELHDGRQSSMSSLHIGEMNQVSIHRAELEMVDRTCVSI
jgi:hypothetical protein